MDSNRVTIAALLFIIAIVGINYAMFIIARNWARGDSRWMTALRDSLRKSTESSSNNSMDELRNKVKELEEKKMEENRN